MVISFSSREGDPYSAFAHDAYASFEEDGRRWHSVTAYALGMRHDDLEVQKKITLKWKAPEMLALEQTLAEGRAEGWAEREPGYLRRGVTRKFEANLTHRALLLSTGDEFLVCEDDPELGAVLMETRAQCRLRADDVEAVQCEHQEADDLVRVCVHLVDSPKQPGHRRFFSGHRLEYALLCVPCATLEDIAKAPTRRVCRQCMHAIPGREKGDLGSPEIVRREGFVRIEVRRRPLRELKRKTRRVVAPAAEPGRWLCVDADSALWSIDGATGAERRLFALPEGALTGDAALDLHVSRDGQFAAVVEARGTRGIVVDLVRGAETMRLSRGDYCVEHCRFPVAFVEHTSRTRLVHGTDWNRLDVSDPRTGALLTAREVAPYEATGPRPAHYLDYFHGALHLSPDQTSVLDDGWVWHPFGVVGVFDVARWLDGNVFESEDALGARGSDLLSRDEWDEPMCWVDDRTIAVWGLDDDGHALIPGVEVIDVSRRERLRSLPGVPRGVAYDRWLLAFAPGQGSSVWDITTGERLAHEPGFDATGYHRAGRCLWALEGDALVTGHVVETKAT